jgi:3-deoxy-D-manno-octulosonic-acid transferase
MEKIKNNFPAKKILLTFFSPSGYEVRKNYAGADYVFYLPMDSKMNAKRFVDLINPLLVIFIKYDFWYYYLDEIKRRKINCLLISAVFYEKKIFFKWYGTLQRKMLNCFTQIFVQNKKSKTLLETINVNCVVSGDTRFDTVTEIANKFEPIEIIEEYLNSKRCIVAGSTWKDDEEVLKKIFDDLNDYDLKLIIAPHEIHEVHLLELKKLFPGSINFSDLSVSSVNRSNVLIIDNIGMLSRLYKYAFIAFVGGGFTKDGIHNILEAAVYGKPVVFGENYKKYREAIELIDIGGAKSFSDKDELYRILVSLLTDEKEYDQYCTTSKKYVWENRGATDKIFGYIAENRLLTK